MSGGHVDQRVRLPFRRPGRGYAGSAAGANSWLLALLLGGAVAVLRAFRLGPTFDLFYDEVLYQEIGRTVYSGGFPRAGNQLFFLHPPAFFYLEAGWERLLGPSADVVAAVYQVRLLNSVLSGVSAFLLVLLVSRVSSPAAGAVAGVLFALDPYAARINGKVLLETSALTWVLLGYVLLLPVLAGESRRPTVRSLGTGAAFALALLTKDLTLMVTIVPLWLAARRYGVPRRLVLLISLATAAPYAVYVLLLWQQGHFGEFWAQKTSGVRRLLGLIQISGFNQAGAPSLTGQLLRQLSDYGSTYAVLFAGLLAAVLVWRHGSRPARYLTVCYLLAGVTMAYVTVRGALEEQFLYLLLIPSLIMVALAAPALRRKPIRVAAIALLTVLLAANAVTYIRWHTSADDGFARVRAYMVANLPIGTPVIVVDATGRYVLQEEFRVGTWTSPAERRRVGVHYIVVPWREVAQGYSAIDTGIDAATVRMLTAHAEELVSVRERSYGEVALYRLP